MRKRFISLLKEETAKGTYSTSKTSSAYPIALTYKSRTSKSYISSFLAALVCPATASTSEYECIWLTFAATSIRLAIALTPIQLIV
jgi:hypothetical protein